MSKTNLADTESIKELNVPSEINSNTAKLVYVYLKTVKQATVKQLCNSLSLKQITLLPILSLLEENNFINKSKNSYTILE